MLQPPRYVPCSTEEAGDHSICAEFVEFLWSAFWTPLLRGIFTASLRLNKFELKFKNAHNGFAAACCNWKGWCFCSSLFLSNQGLYTSWPSMLRIACELNQFHPWLGGSPLITMPGSWLGRKPSLSLLPANKPIISTPHLFIATLELYISNWLRRKVLNTKKFCNVTILSEWKGLELAFDWASKCLGKLIAHKFRSKLSSVKLLNQLYRQPSYYKRLFTNLWKTSSKLVSNRRLSSRRMKSPSAILFELEQFSVVQYKLVPAWCQFR